MPAIRPFSSLSGTIVNSTEIGAPPCACLAPQQLPMPISALARPHHLGVACPMAAPQTFRNDQVKDSHGFGIRVAEDALGAGVPKRDHAIPVRRNDGVGFGFENGAGQFCG